MCSFSPETDCFNVFAFTVENWPESHKPVEISDLRPCGPCVAQGIPRVQPGALTCISHHLTAEARNRTAITALRLLAVLNVLFEYASARRAARALY